MIYTYLGETIRFDIKYKNRQSVGIYIDYYGNIEVHAPKGTPNEKVVRLIEEKWELLRQKTKEMNDRWHGPVERGYDPGETFLYLGNSYPIQVYHDSNIVEDYVLFEGNTLMVYVKQLEDETIQQALKQFYYQQCKALVEKSIAANQNYFKKKPRSIRISDSKTTWGTCDSKRQLTFNWKLAMAPQEVIDYVVVHEMCHMVHLNHDRSFWRLVGSIIPDYKEQERWLALSSWKMTV